MGAGVGPEPPRFLGHPVHPPTTHLPLGVLTASVVWDGAALLTGGELWWRLAWWCLLLGVAGSLPTVLTGLLEFVSLPEGHPASDGATRHMVSALAALGLFAVSAALRGGVPEPARVVWAVGASGLGLVILAFTGWSGGDLVFRHGLGTEAGSTDSEPD